MIELQKIKNNKQKVLISLFFPCIFYLFKKVWQLGCFLQLWHGCSTSTCRKNTNSKST